MPRYVFPAWVPRASASRARIPASRTIRVVVVAVAMMAATAGCASAENDSLPGEPTTITPKTIVPVSAQAEPTAATDEAGAGPVPVLGKARTHTVGYGEARPAVISWGSTCASTITKVQWDTWGTTTATGSGVPCWQASTGDSTPARLVASDLGDCNGVRAYRMLTVGGSQIPACAN